MWHTQVARPAHVLPSAVADRRWLRCAGGIKACLARCVRRALARLTQVARSAKPPPQAVAGGWGVTARERHGDVRGSLRSRRAGCGTYKWHALRTSCRRPAVPGGRRGRRAHDKPRQRVFNANPRGGGSPGLGGRSRALGVSASRRNSRARTQLASMGGSPALRQILCWRRASDKLKQRV